MLEIKISAKKPSVVIPPFQGKSYTYVAPTSVPPNAVLQEAQRRDKIIQALVKDMPYSRGDVCIPRTDKGKEDYGRCKILHVAENYASLGKNYEWSADDNPLIVHAKCLDKPLTFFCSVNYLEKVNE